MARRSSPSTKRPVLNKVRAEALKTAVRVLRNVLKESLIPQDTQGRAELMVAIAFIEATIGTYAPTPEAPHTGDRRNGI